jgi:hypothetical protein
VCSARIRARAASPILRAASGPVASRIDITSDPESAHSTSRPGSKNASMPSHASQIKQAAAPAASKTRVGGEKPVLAMLSRLMLMTMRGEQLNAL